MTAPFDEAAARKLLDAWPEVPGLDDLVAAFVEARAAGKMDDMMALPIFEDEENPNNLHIIYGDERSLNRVETALTTAVGACNGGGEPVAWQFRWRRLDRVGGWSHWAEATGGPEQIAFLQTSSEHEVRPLYTAPQPAAEAWRDISSAPKDGTEVDLWLAPLAESGAALTPCRVPNAHFHCDEWLVYSGEPEVGYHTINHRITHWRPLPTPPGAPTRGGGTLMVGMCACGRYLSQCVAPHCDRLDPRSGRSEVPAERGQRVSAARLAQLIEYHDSPHNAGSATIGALALDLRDARAELVELVRRVSFHGLQWGEAESRAAAWMEKCQAATARADRLAAENAGLRAAGREDGLREAVIIIDEMAYEWNGNTQEATRLRQGANRIRARLIAPAGDPS